MYDDLDLHYVGHMSRFHSLELTDDELYWAGLIHADGSIERDRLRVRLVQKDRHVVEEFLRFLDQDSKVTHVAREYGFGWSEGYSVSTRTGVGRLLDLGVKGDVDASLYTSRHFWRGLVDGDGTVYVDRRGYATIALCSGKERDVAAFSSWAGSLMSYRGPSVYRNSRSGYYVQMGGGRARALGLYLYRDSYSAYPRKRDAALSFESLTTRTSVALL